jgi:hypothetical protein
MSTTKQLEKKLGGKWTYRGRTTWECDDEKRWVERYYPLVYENETMLDLSPLTQYLLYEGEAEMPKRFVLD